MAVGTGRKPLPPAWGGKPVDAKRSRLDQLNGRLSQLMANAMRSLPSGYR